MVRYGFYAIVGIALLIANLFYVRSLAGLIRGSGLVVAPFEIVSEEKADDSRLGLVLARMLCSRLQDLYAELNAAQSIVRSTGPGVPGAAVPSAAGPVFLPASILHPTFVRLPTLFKPVDIKASVAGVEVGGLLSWLHEFSSEPRAVKFSVVVHKNGTAQVSGDVSAFSKQMGGALWLATKAEPESLVTDIAATLLQRKLSEDSENHVELLTLSQFEGLLHGISLLATLNRQTAGGVDSLQQMKSVYEEVEQVSDQVRSWSLLRLLTAELARRVGESEKAIEILEELDAARQKSSDSRQLADLLLKANVAETLAQLKKDFSAGGPSSDIAARIAADIKYALNFYRDFFEIDNLSVPSVKIDSGAINAYFDGSQFVAHPVTAHCPDVTYHEMFHAINNSLGLQLAFRGQSGALFESLADVFASVVKQKRQSQTAETADWLMGVGFLEPFSPAAAKSAIRSLKEPGAAYRDDPVLGSDPQPAHMSKFSRTHDDNGGVHINCGIPNKAFYNAARAVGTEKAALIWRDALKNLKPDTRFEDFAAKTAASATRLYGAAESAHIKAAWQDVGLLPDKAARVRRTAAGTGHKG